MGLKDFTKGFIVLNALAVVSIAVLVIIVLKNQILGGLETAISAVLILGLFNAVFLLLFSNIKSSLDSLNDQLHLYAKGDITNKKEIKQNWLYSVDGINNSIVDIQNGLSETLNNITQIANDDLENELKQLSDEDKMGIELIALQSKLKEDKAELEKTKKAEEKRNWITAGLTKFGEILRQESENIQEMGYSIISNLVDYVDLNQGALYVLSESEGDEQYYETIASVAYNRQKSIESNVKLGEGLVGQCAYEQKRIYMTQIPDDYINITSGLGAANPSTLLIVPCLIEDRVFGIIEVASFHEIEDHQIEFIERLGESIASTVSNFQNAERTHRLLSASKNQSEELAAHEEELRQNLEEMETTQEDLHRQMKLNAEMQKELKFEKYLFDTLLTNIPARINFKNNKHEFIRASKSFLDFFDKESNEEIIGKTDVDFFGAEFASKTMADEKEIMSSKQGRINFIEYQKKDDGTEMWKNVSKIPLYDDDGNCMGIFASVHDVTESKLAEKTLADEKLLFDTMLNNIPARINFKDADRKYLRASKSFLERFGKESNDEIIGKTDVDFFGEEFAAKTMADELKIMQSREGRINFIEHEEKEDGEQIWKNVSKIPLIDEDDNVIGLFASVYDITDYKLNELENEKLKKEIAKLKKKK